MLFPGPKITNPSAFIFAILDIHRLNHNLSKQIAEIFMNGTNKNIYHALKNLKEVKLSLPRQKIIKDLEKRENLQEDFPMELLTRSQLNTYNLLLGKPVLPQGAHAARITLEIF